MACAGAESDALAIDLAEGMYDIDARTYEADGGTELLLNRLVRR